MSHEIPTPMNAIAGISELDIDFNLSDSEKKYNSSDSLFWRGACRHRQRYS